MTRSFVVPLKVIPEHTVTRCDQCEHFLHGGAPYGDGDACEYNVLYGGEKLKVVSWEIHKYCPILEEQQK